MIRIKNTYFIYNLILYQYNPFFFKSIFFFMIKIIVMVIHREKYHNIQFYFIIHLKIKNFF